MTGLVLTLALLVSLAAVGRRFYRKALLRKKKAALPGMSRETAIEVDNFDEIEAQVRRLRCPCGGRYDLKGESSSENGGRRFRTAGIECRFCEERMRVFFDVTGIFH